MNESPDPIRPDDDASDPLLTALRQRLGNYGEAPPPGAWTGIRQRLPAAVARPWWRRPRRLLPLVALLLGLVATGLLTRRAMWPAGGLATAKPANTGSAPGTTKQLGRPALLLDKQVTKSSTDSPGAANALPPAARLKSAQPDSRPSAQATHNPEHSHRAGTRRTELPALNQPARRLPLAAKDAHERGGLLLSTSRNELSSMAARNKLRRAPGRRPVVGALADAWTTPGRSRRTALTAGADVARLPRAVGRLAAVAGHQRVSKQRRSAIRTLMASRNQVARRPGFAAGIAARYTDWLPPRRHASVAKPGALAADWSTANRQRPGAVITDSLINIELSQSIDILQVTNSKLAPVPLTGLPAPLVARPDSLRPPYPPMRRWALLALAGPTLSYRTIGPAPATTTGYPDFAHLERPAAGLGAQVQVRRVLSGRWALAVGVGYQEYATRLALQLADSGGARIRQRDTYQLLTLPVQLSYALGAPRGRLAKGLLLGAEAGWYQGGRSTEGSDCGCQQQPYTAAASPYRPWSLALSLGLDLRYRVGGPASRWQWVVQPTGRYVLSPFVRPNTAGFSQRQPFSLGVLTGFSWDIR